MSHVEAVPRIGRRARRVADVVGLIRPLNVAMIVGGVGVGGIMAAGVDAWMGEPGGRLLRAACAAALVGAGANSLNDVVDRRIDAINRPERPLASGRVSPVLAGWIGVLAVLGGIALGGMLSTLHLVLTLGAVGLLLMYNAYLKNVPLLGNLLIAGLIGLALVYGGLAVGYAAPAFVGGVFAALTTLAREILKDVEDVAGDAVSGARTLPIVAGVPAALRAALGITVGTLVLTPVPFVLLDYTGAYLLAVLVPDVLLLRICWLLLDDAPERHVRRSSQLFKVTMAAGMVALVVGALVELGG